VMLPRILVSLNIVSFPVFFDVPAGV
jgi:hypothetical protein